MKFLLLYSIFLLLTLFANGQREIPKITNENHLSLFKYCQYNVKSIDLDTLDNTIRIFEKLNEFDSSLYSLDILSPLLESMENSYVKSFKSNIIGKWSKKWEIFDIPMCGELINYKRTQTATFTDDSIFIYRGKTLFAKYGYTIIPKYSPFFFSQSFQFLLNSNSKVWSFVVSQKHPVFPENNNQRTLYISLQTLVSPGFTQSEVYVKPLMARIQ